MGISRIMGRRPAVVAAPATEHPLRRVVVAVLVLAASSGSALAASSVDEPAPLSAETAHRDALEREAARRAAFERLRATPAERAAREESRTAFVGLEDSAAVAMVRDGLTPLKSLRPHRSDKFRRGRLKQFVGERAAQVTLPNGKTLMATSDVPMRTKNASGALAAVDLTLTRSAEGYRPENPLVRLTLPDTLAQPLVLSDDHLRVRLATSAAAASGARVDGGVVYPNVGPDTDAVLHPTAKGAEIGWVVRSGRAEEAFRFSVADDGAEGSVRLVALESGAIGIERAGLPEAVVLPPVAMDADGLGIPTEMSLDGSDVVVRAAHRDADVKYPVWVDPPMEDVRDWQGGGSNEYRGWLPALPSGGHMLPVLADASSGWPDQGLYMFARGGYSHVAGQLGYWWFAPPRQSFIPEVDFEPVVHAPGGPNRTSMVAGLMHPSSGAPLWAASHSFFEHADTGAVDYAPGPLGRTDDVAGTAWTCVTVDCDEEQGQDGVRAVFGLQIAGSHTPTSTNGAYAGGATVYMSDRNNPGMQTTGSIPSGWRDSGAFSVQATLSDEGMGPLYMNMMYRRGSGDDAEEILLDEDGYLCFDPMGQNCSTSFTRTLDSAFNVAPHGLPDGPGTIEVSGIDWVERSSNVVSFPVKVDKTGPSFNPYGSLMDADGILDEESYVLHPDATDESSEDPSVLQSGLKRLLVEIAGPNGEAPVTQLYHDGTAGCEGCGKNPAITVTPKNFSIGMHRIRMEAIDQTYPEHVNVQDIMVNVTAGRMLTPHTGQRAARLVPLQVETDRSNVNGVAFEFRKPGTAWSWLPTTPGIVKRSDGSSVSQWPMSFSSGSGSGPWASPALSWDARNTPGITGDGTIHVRAMFYSNGTFVGHGRIAEIQLDRNFLGSTYATAGVGPGEVTLSSGNYALSEQDVSIEAPATDLTVLRTYNSRQGTANANGVLGPGWTLTTPVLAAGLSYNRVEKAADGSAAVYLADGTMIPFSFSDGKLLSPPGFRDLKLYKGISPDRFELVDAGGAKATFTPEGSSTTKYVPTSVSVGGERTDTTWAYATVNGVQRPTVAIAPAPKGVTCTPTSLPAGCRALKFEYADAGSVPAPVASGLLESQWGNHAGRLMRVKFHAANPNGSMPEDTTVAEYRYDNLGKLREVKDPRTNLFDRYTYDASNLTEYAPPGGEPPWRFEYAATTTEDTNPGRLARVKRAALPGATPADRVWSIEYNQSLTSPYNLSESEVAKWNQHDLPVTATAIYPPTQLPSQGNSHATFYYLNANALAVNVARPGGKISVTEYDHHRNAVRELSAKNRATALAAGANSVAQSLKVDTQRTYNTAGTQLWSEVGPEHLVRRDDSSTQMPARRVVVNEFDLGAPTSGRPYNLITKTTVSARLADATLVDSRTTQFKYDGQGDLGWKLRQPTEVITDPGGLNLKTRTAYDPDLGVAIETSQPSDAEQTTAGTTKTTLFTTAAQTAWAACGNKPALAGMPCIVEPAVQPVGPQNGPAPGPQIPPVVYDYNRLLLPIFEWDYGPATGVSRYVSTTYDSAGRKASEAITGTTNDGAPVATVAYSYDAAGRPFKTVPNGVEADRIERTYNELGLLKTYRDATGTVSTYGYDSQDRVASVFDGKGTRTLTYDLNSNVQTVHDSQAGTFTGEYDADDDLIGQLYPNNVKASWVRNELGEPNWAWYVKQAPCTTNCAVAVNVGVRNVHGQLRQSASHGDQTYFYDKAGRLTSTHDTFGGLCTKRIYGYDQNSNRVQLNTVLPLTTGACDLSANPGTAKQYAYDTGDRLIGTGITYDGLGRTTALPDTHAGGTPLTTEYYTNDLVKRLVQGTTNYTYTLDANRRVLGRGTTGSQTNHYSDDTDEPAWTGTNLGESQYQRHIAGVDGDLAAIYNSQTGVAMQYVDLHGDVMMTASATPNPPGTGALSTHYADEFGIPRMTPGRYTWLGAKQRSAELNTGTVLMGARVYQPQLGRFLQVDPVAGGSANRYDYANQDPLNTFDLDGLNAVSHRINSMNGNLTRRNRLHERSMPFEPGPNSSARFIRGRARVRATVGRPPRGLRVGPRRPSRLVGGMTRTGEYRVRDANSRGNPSTRARKGVADTLKHAIDQANDFG